MTVQINEISSAIGVEPLAVNENSAGSIERAGGFYRKTGKRAFDLFLVLVSAPVWLPVLGFSVAWLLLRGQRAFYTQQRVGKNGRHFRIFKLCTMVDNADERLAEYLRLNPDARQEWNATQKLKHDPRITRTGHFLRKSSLDEVPQILNVILGDMSLVGPRPMLLSQAPMYSGRAYYDLLPGLTGTWQISDRNDCAFTERVVFDEQYYRDVSLSKDLSVLARTVSVVLRGTGY